MCFLVAALRSAFATGTTASAPHGPEPNPGRSGVLPIGEDEFLQGRKLPWRASALQPELQLL